MEAVEKSKYGWFWQCPTGESCIYRHALPPGFVLKRDKKALDKKDEITLEELIEKERAALGPTQTKVTLETFLAWKKRKIQEKKDAAKKDEDKKRSDYKAGRQVGLSGREMFSFNPEMAAENDLEDGDEAFDSSLYRNNDEDEDTVEYKEINLDILGNDASDVSIGVKVMGGVGYWIFRWMVRAQWLQRTGFKLQVAIQTLRMSL